MHRLIYNNRKALVNLFFDALKILSRIVHSLSWLNELFNIYINLLLLILCCSGIHVNNPKFQLFQFFYYYCQVLILISSLFPKFLHLFLSCYRTLFLASNSFNSSVAALGCLNRGGKTISVGRQTSI